MTDVIISGIIGLFAGVLLGFFTMAMICAEVVGDDDDEEGTHSEDSESSTEDTEY